MPRRSLPLGFCADKEAEDAHKAEIEGALHAAREELEGGQAVPALLAFAPVLPYVQPMSTLGSACMVELARAHETLGEEEQARRVYEQLLSHPKVEVRNNARALLGSVKSRTERLSGQASGSWWDIQWDKWR